MTSELNELALFAGAGGGILGGKLLGWKTVCAVELDDYARRVLLARQDDGCLPPFPIWDDVRTFDGKPWRGLVDVISGGFPCQDISVVGTGQGLDGEHSGLWREMSRIIGEVRPRHVIVENSAALAFRGLGVVLGDLATLGYDAVWGVFSAADAGARHQREGCGSMPTPCRYGNGGTGATKKLKSLGIDRCKINPNHQEWLMMWPQGWTELTAPATDKFRLWCESHGIPCDVAEGSNGALCNDAPKIQQPKI